MGMTHLPPIEVLRRLFDCDPLTGVLTFRSRPREDFDHDRHWRMWLRRYEGKSAGSLRQDGYLIVSPVIKGVTHPPLAHRLIWAIMHGGWVPVVDHRNGCGSDNRLANLRDAVGQSENMQNMAAHARRGVSIDARGPSPLYNARITRGGKVVHLGSFGTPEAAHAAYLEAKERLHAFQPVPR